MEKTDYILVSRKERKDVERVKHALELLGFDIDKLLKIDERINEIEKSFNDLSISVNESFKEVNDKIENFDKSVDLTAIKDELKEFINEKMLTIQENVVKSNKEVIGGIQTTFQSIFNGGHKIDENH